MTMHGATRIFAPGGYRFVPGVFQYSAGVAALEGFQIERAVLRVPLPLAEGFARIEAHLRDLGRPLTALCACELRSPAPFSEESFTDFNRAYVEPLRRWGLMFGDVNPVARTNVCPDVLPPSTPSLYAFAYTIPQQRTPVPSFVVAGSGEAPEGRGNYRDHIIRPGDTSVDALLEKARWVLAEMERRMSALDADWGNASVAQVYTVHDIFPLMSSELGAKRVAGASLCWHLARPPVKGLDYEMDVRGIAIERVLV